MSDSSFDGDGDAITCRLAIIGAQRQRVAKVSAILHADNSRSKISIDTLVSLKSTSGEKSGVPDTDIQLPKGVPSEVHIEYVPCVATFDSYEDEHGTNIRYLAKLEYHGPNGTLVKGKSLAPFFDNDIGTDNNNVDNNDNIGDKVNHFPGISAAAIGCGIETEDDVEKVQSFLETLSASCASQLSITKKNSDKDDQSSSGILIKCIKPNAEYSTMKEENEAFRELNEDEKKEAVEKGTIGPGKMANFAYSVAKDSIRRRWDKELTKYEHSLQLAEAKESNAKTEEAEPEQQISALESDPTAQVEIQSTHESVSHIPNPEKTRYACKRCRSILFGVEDLENPPHVQSQHNFRKKTHKTVYGNTGTCQNHFIAQPLSWMNGCNGMEGKLHCYKCNTKVGHYSWTGAQCSCGTWVTPAIMVPMSKVDEMKPMSQNVIESTGALFVNHNLQNLILK